MKMGGMGEVTEVIETTVIDGVYEIYELIAIADYDRFDHINLLERRTCCCDNIHPY